MVGGISQRRLKDEVASGVGVVDLDRSGDRTVQADRIAGDGLVFLLRCLGGEDRLEEPPRSRLRYLLWAGSSYGSTFSVRPDGCPAACG